MSNKTALISVKIATWKQLHMIYLPLYIGVYGGYAAKNGLSVELIPAGNDDQIFAQVVSGAADFGFGDPVFVEMSRASASCIAMAVKRPAIWGITHNPAIPQLTKVEDFVQLRIGSFPKPSTVYTLLAGLKHRHKRLLKYMQIVPAPIGEQAGLLLNNKADVAIELEPMVSLAEAKGMKVVLSIADFYEDSAFTGLTALDRTIQTRPELIDKMVRLLQHGLDVCLNDRARALTVACQVFPDYPPEILERSIERLKSHGAWPETTKIDPKIWKAAIKLRRQVGDLSDIKQTA